ncbi:MAG: hypothetical protein H0Z28_02665 [Archaeoglobus sp.]|nr:hypothetical protein [Archaeoglobus sp.]
MVKIKELVQGGKERMEKAIKKKEGRLDGLYNEFKKAVEENRDWDAMFIADAMLLLRQGGESWNGNIDWWVVESFGKRFRMNGQVW